MDFKELLIRAKLNNPQAMQQVFELYKPLLVKESLLHGSFDEDLYQELCEVLLICMKTFKFKY